MGKWERKDVVALLMMSDFYDEKYNQHAYSHERKFIDGVDLLQ